MNTVLSKCPMCKSDINEGAVACKSCGATEIDGWDAMGVIKKYTFGLVPMAMAIMVGLMVLIFSPKTGL